VFDLVFKSTRKSFPQSANRVKKFCASTHFTFGAHELAEFEAPIALRDALEVIRRKEIINPGRSMRIFITE
jgi:hypothetical protein